MNIHKTAIIDPKSELADDISVGPYAVIDANVKIGSGAKIGPHCVINEYTQIGKNCHIFPGAVIGSVSQDKKYNGEKSFLKIGDNNIIREYVTMNRGTNDGSTTMVGNNNLFMAYSHVAHDCNIGNEVVLANSVALAGHVCLQDGAIIGGLTGVHQFVRIGELAIVGGCSKAGQDIVPFSVSDGHRAKVYGVNTIGLDRRGYAEGVKENLKKAFKIIFSMKLNIKNALKKVEKEIPPSKEVTKLIDFIKSSQRGIAR
ncbi:acyl-ACP--UDP-N-acetylglucosamine O-acyltransferase [Candidatus Omnitrophota bacterium]